MLYNCSHVFLYYQNETKHRGSEHTKTILTLVDILLSVVYTYYPAVLCLLYFVSFNKYPCSESDN